MSELSNRRSSAIRVLLQHSLSSAMALAEKFKREYAENDARTGAVDHWVRSIKQALSVCGVYGLCAVDRAEEQVLMCIRQDACLDDYFREQFEGKAKLFGHSAKCYEQALLHQKFGSVNLLAMWVYTGHCTDKVISLQAEAAPQHTSRGRLYSYSNSLTTLNSAVQEKLRLALEKMQAAVSGGEIPTAQLHRLAYEQFSRAAAYVLLDDLFATYTMVFPRTREADRVIVQCGRAANEAGDCLTIAAGVTSMVSDSERGEHLGPLRRLLIEGYKRAAELLSPWQHPPDQRSVGRCVASSAQTVHTLVTSLAPAAAQLQEQSRGAQVSSRAAWLKETEQVLVDACRQIADSPIGKCLSEPTNAEPRYQETTRLTALVAAVVERIKGGASKYDQDERVIAECVAKGQAVNRKVSPAHALMGDCWLQAAMQLRNAVDAATADAAATAATDQSERPAGGYFGSVPPSRESLLRRCAKVYADLATVTFADAATYLQRSKRAPAGQARELWKEASELLMKVGKERIKTTESALAKLSHYNDPRECSSRLEAQESCGRHCASTAELLEGLCRTGDEKDEKSAQRAECRLAMAVVRLERTAIAMKQRDALYTVGRYCLPFASLLVDVIALIRSQGSTPEPLPPHIAHLQPATTPEDSALRQLRIEWLCGACLAASDLICARPDQVCGDGARAMQNALANCRAVYTAVTGYDRTSYDYGGYGGYGGYEEDVVVAEGGTESHQRACDRYLEAVAADAAGRAQECTAWMKAGDVEGNVRKVAAHDSPEAVQYAEVLGDTLTRAAWRLREPEGLVPAHLLAFAEGLPEGFQHTRLVDIAVEAEMEHGKQTAAQSRLQKKPTPVNALHKRAAEQFALATTTARDQVVFAVVLGGQTERRTAVAERAMVSGRRFAQAAEALEEGRAEVSSLFVRAAELVSTNSTSCSKPNSEETQAVADKAGERYEQAARALAAGKRDLHQHWTRAAQAAEALLVVTITKTTKRCTLALADGYSESKVAEADALAAQATTAGASAVGASSAGKRKAPQAGQNKEKSGGASSKEGGQATKRKRKE